MTNVTPRRAWAPFTAALRTLGFTRTYFGMIHGQACAEYHDIRDGEEKTGDRGLVVQLWGNRRHRVSHRTRGEHGWIETTPPTGFTTVEAMRIAIKYERIRPSAPGAVEHRDYITVAKLGSGYAALHMRWYADITNYDVQQTGHGRYGKRSDAEREARDWAKSDQIELRL